MHRTFSVAVNLLLVASPVLNIYYVIVGLHLCTANVKVSPGCFCCFLNKVGCIAQLCKVLCSIS